MSPHSQGIIHSNARADNRRPAIPAAVAIGVFCCYHRHAIHAPLPAAPDGRRDHNGQALAYVYYEEEPGRRSAARLLSYDADGQMSLR